MFTVFIYKQTELGLVKLFLTNDGQWAIATNNPKKYQTKNQIIHDWAKGNIVSPVACLPIIEGPSRGLYAVNNGRYLR